MMVGGWNSFGGKWFASRRRDTNTAGSVSRIASLLDAFAREHGLGTVTGADGGYVLFDEPPTVRAPDAAFVRRERLAPEIKGFPPLAPDLAVEVISPSNTMTEIQARVLEYLDAGSRLVWVVDPDPEP